jgi:hypothetical protein
MSTFCKRKNIFTSENTTLNKGHWGTFPRPFSKFVDKVVDPDLYFCNYGSESSDPASAPGSYYLHKIQENIKKYFNPLNPSNIIKY